ncbi:hypothetical protein AAGS61_12825 [Lysinibacillus sp. KU-BSD001]|uniref:hypothetical protein n=1 Tax=Lysinibacillus sp. KU-BSD001 TaxID=3141328 RepID=UPI0036E1B585
MRNVASVLLVALLLFGSPFLSNQEVPSILFLFIGIVLLITIVAIVYIHQAYPNKHKAMLKLSVYVFIVVIFVPCFARINILDETITDWTFIRYVAIFITAPIILASTVIFGYRHHLMLKK